MCARSQIAKFKSPGAQDILGPLGAGRQSQHATSYRVCYIAPAKTHIAKYHLLYLSVDLISSHLRRQARSCFNSFQPASHVEGSTSSSPVWR
jgi:hypothetical protein